MRNFWRELPKPFFALAPMEDVTDAAFRALIASYSAPAVPRVIFTEFTSADGLLLADESGRRKLLKKLEYSEAERPIVAQIFTPSPQHMEQAAQLCAELGFDGFDINMGCPDRSVEKSGCGAALMKNSALAQELIRAAQRGWSSKYGHAVSIFPISVKTRIGYDKDELETWLAALLKAQPAAVTLHTRTRKEMSDVPARWERIARAVEVRDDLQNPRGDASRVTRIIGNGDVRDLAEACAKAKETGCDGVMLGRAVFGNPWIFAEREGAPSPCERLQALARHLELFEELLASTTNFAVMKKHFKAYVGGWHGAKELRTQLMETESVAGALAFLRSAILSA